MSNKKPCDFLHLYMDCSCFSSPNNCGVMRSTLCGFIGTSWRGILCNTKPLGFVFKGYRVQCFSTRRSRARQLPKEGPPTIMEEESNAFYVVRKGDIIGIYNNLRDCQAQVSSSVIFVFFLLLRVQFIYHPSFISKQELQSIYFNI